MPDFKDKDCDDAYKGRAQDAYCIREVVKEKIIQNKRFWLYAISLYSE